MAKKKPVEIRISKSMVKYMQDMGLYKEFLKDNGIDLEREYTAVLDPKTGETVVTQGLKPKPVKKKAKPKVKPKAKEK